MRGKGPRRRAGALRKDATRGGKEASAEHTLRPRYYALSTPLASVRQTVIDCRKLRLSPLRDGCYSDAAGALGRCSSCAPSLPPLPPFRAVKVRNPYAENQGSQSGGRARRRRDDPDHL